MKPTIEGLEIKKFDIRALAFEKGIERGIQVIEGATKNSIFDDEIEIKTQEGELKSNDILISKSGRETIFKKGSFNELKNNIQKRKTGKIEREIR